MRTSLLSLTVLLLLFTSTAINADELTATNSINFPGEKTKLWSPNGLYAVECASRTPVRWEPRNWLYFLTRKPTSKQPLSLLLSKTNGFNHNVDVLWSPTSTKFIVNDWSPGPGSSVDSYLYRVIDIAHPIDIGALLEKTISDPETFLGETTIIAESWSNSHLVKLHCTVRHSAESNSPAELFYEWDVTNNKFKRITTLNASSRETHNVR